MMARSLAVLLSLLVLVARTPRVDHASLIDRTNAGDPQPTHRQLSRAEGDLLAPRFMSGTAATGGAELLRRTHFWAFGTRPAIGKFVLLKPCPLIH